ncbi:hypothetical protein CR205_04075 [Alteribacter lacisalsi]|uniref:Uncharacterized protein n=1 Tax=Alteribacter lacisalsi TaxID=2045244 RepID=A0A2W0HVR4_9BACI|nr:hypothetical protein [Alteribacter lacisalsi]PYZ97778.1 hypothetical protein CR205_04075 [Alteribacter lacisalsi]
MKKYLMFFLVGIGIGFMFQVVGWVLYHMPEGVLDYAGIYALAILPMALMLYVLYKSGMKEKKGNP